MLRSSPWQPSTAAGGLTVPSPGRPPYAPAAARRAAALASHREAVAQLERALRFASGTRAVTVAGLYDELAAELTLLDRAPPAHFSNFGTTRTKPYCVA
jgi:hypothetical protein